MTPRNKPLPVKPVRAIAKAASGICQEHEYRVNVDEAVARIVSEAFEKQHRHKISNTQAPARPGVYAIYEKGKRYPVYVGKAARTIRDRLGNHGRKIAKTPQLAGDKYECTYLAIPEAWWVVLAETFLIKKYRPPWNGAGFASNVPGVGRPGIKKSLWQQYLDGELPENEARRRALPADELAEVTEKLG